MTLFPDRRNALGIESVAFLIYRLTLIYLAYSLSRLLFFVFNAAYFEGIDFRGFIQIFIGGLKFDTAAIIYTNLIYIVGMSIPFTFRSNKTYNKVLFWIYIITNSIAILANVADIAYYPFTLRRTTCIIFGQFANEQNMPLLLLHFTIKYWYFTLIYFGMIASIVFLYRPKLTAVPSQSNPRIYYTAGSIIFLLTIALAVGGMRGGFRKSTRPITLSNAGEYVSRPSETALVLNTPFALIRTINKTGLKKVAYFPEDRLASLYPVEYFPKPEQAFTPKNIVIFILESFSREFVESLNKNRHVKDYRGYTPFLDSLIKHSLVFENAMANGKKSIEALPSVIAGIPGTDVPYVLTPYSSNELGSLPNLLKPKGYKTAFFHGAPNGSMGFSSFTRIAGIEKYYGKNEYANDKDFDGTWGIWDEPFFQFMARTVDGFKQPFCVELFSVSSHEPFAIPRQYEGKLKKGPLPLHQCINYTDRALRRFFETAQRMPWFKNTLFVITADHASFPYYKEFNNSIDHFSIPLIFYTPDRSLQGFDTTSVAQQIDILPTVLNYLHFDKPYLAFGKNLLGRHSNTAINYLDGNYHFFKGDYVLLFDGESKHSLYNYKKDRNLTHALPPDSLSASMLEQTKAFIQQYNNRQVENRLTVKQH